MLPALLLPNCLLIYGSSMNTYHNNLRTRCLLFFVFIVPQILCGYGLQKILDHNALEATKTHLGWIEDRGRAPERSLDLGDSARSAVMIMSVHL
jgi:hypothetical protein